MNKAELLEAILDAPDDAMVYLQHEAVLRTHVLATVFRYDDGDHEIVLEFVPVTPDDEEEE